LRDLRQAACPIAQQAALSETTEEIRARRQQSGCEGLTLWVLVPIDWMPPERNYNRRSIEELPTQTQTESDRYSRFCSVGIGFFLGPLVPKTFVRGHQSRVAWEKHNVDD
jgi:hypothetical protein